MARERETRLAYSTAGETEPDAAPPPPQGTGNIRLRLDRRASGRVVTVVTGLPGKGDAVLALAKALKAAAGTGGTVKDGVLELQGDHRTLVEGALLARGLKSKRSGG
jgi:translation initiation factor 1